MALNDRRAPEKNTLLLVDDVPANIKVLIEALEDDYEIIIATNGERALRWATSETPPDLILLDIMMPEMDGYEVCRRLKADPVTREIPVMFVTAINEEEEEARGLAMGAVDYIHKPYSLSIIKARIQTQLALKVQRDKLAQAQAQLKEANFRLEERVVERTADLMATNNKLLEEVFDHKKTAEALEQARIAAGQASQAKRNFLDNMSHEIRTPINGIVGFTSLLAIAELTEQQRSYVEMITSSSERLLETVDKVLDFAKIESENLQLSGRVFQVDDLIDVTCREATVKARKKGLTIRCQKNLDLSNKVIGDPYRLQQILTNLLENAIKFSQQGEIILGARIDSHFKGGIILHLTVKDQGEGIAQSKQQQIFGAFNQADTSNTRKYEGTGLGLTISALLVQMMGGKIWVESKLGAGSTFHVTVGLDFALDDGERFAIWEAAELVPYHDAGRKVGKVAPRILLAEDEEVNKQMLQDLLEHEGWLVQAVANGKEAVEAYEQGEFDLILMDIQMPEMTGYQATTAIRALEEKRGTQHIPIIAVTAHAMEGDRQQCLAMGMDDYIVKPVKFSTLFQAIRQQLLKQERGE
ncbi:MAG: response regulator [Proteobacteria bacterium]|nr:response regulator [Pseudomonadota bacterium]MBU1639825.1 response regulator [Pseudomonadota bacterium]